MSKIPMIFVIVEEPCDIKRFDRLYYDKNAKIQFFVAIKCIFSRKLSNRI